MAWSHPRSWSTGENVSPTLLNTELRDNLLSLRNNNDILVHCSKSANQTLAATGYTAISWNVHDFIVGTTAVHSTASGTKFQAPAAGWYRLKGTAIYATASGARGVAYQFNGAGANYDLKLQHRGGTLTPPELYFNDVIQMTTADYIQVNGFLNSNTSATLIGGASQSRVTWYLAGAAT